MSELLYLFTPASIGVFIFTRQKKKIRNVDVVLLYLFNVLVTNIIYNIIMNKFYPNTKIVYTVNQNFKMMILLSAISFVMGIIYVYIDKRFSIVIEDSKNEKKTK